MKMPLTDLQHAYVMRENAFTPCRKRIPYVRSETRYDARWRESNRMQFMYIFGNHYDFAI